MAFDPVLTWGFLGVGVFGQSVALMLVRRPIRLLRAGGKAQGTVTGNDEQMIAGTRSSAKKYYFPQIAFTTARGERIAFKSTAGRRVAMPAGTAIPLIYDPAKPHDAALNSFVSLWLFPVATSLFILPFLAIGLVGALS